MPIEESKYVWMNGAMISWHDGNVHFLNPGMQYGCAVFEGIRAYSTEKGTCIFRLTEHVERLFNSARVLSIEIPFSREEIEEAIIKTVRDNGLKDCCYIRPTVWKGYDHMGLDQREAPVEIGIGAFHWEPYISQSGIRVKISNTQKNSSWAVPTTAKICGPYANSLIAKQDARASGFDEAILLNDRGFVAEATAQNVFAVNENCVRTPPENADILMGITRDSALTLGKELGYNMKEGDLAVEDLFDANEVFLTGTASEVAPVIEIGKTKIGDGTAGPVTLKLQKRYADTVRGKVPEHIDWLTPVEEERKREKVYLSLS